MMLGSAARKMAWMARTTTTVVGLAIMLALVLGVATTALAGTGIGATFNLGKINTVNAVSKLVGSVAGSSLSIDNNSQNANATALDLQVEAGKAPMKVNSGTVVANLNSDRLDGQNASAFFSGKTYIVQQSKTLVPSSTSALPPTVFEPLCDQGDVALSGGFSDADTTRIETSGPSRGGTSWTVLAVNTSQQSLDEVTAEVVCADFGAPHQP